MEHYNVVEKTYDEMIRQGLIYPVQAGANQTELVDDQKALFTRRCAYYLNTSYPNLGLLSKTTGNNRLGLSVDCIYDKATCIEYDIATDADGLVKPVNTDGRTNNEVHRWIQPTRELAGLKESDTPIPNNPPPNDLPSSVITYEQLIEDLAVKIVSKLDPKFAALDTRISQIKTCIFRR